MVEPGVDGFDPPGQSRSRSVIFQVEVSPAFSVRLTGPHVSQYERPTNVTRPNRSERILMIANDSQMPMYSSSMKI